NLYLQKNMQINNIFRRYVGDEDIWVYSVDETFVRVNASQRLFKMSAYDFAKRFQQDILNELGLYCTVGIGDNMLLSKLALDNEAKYNQDMIATWHYEDVPHTVWQIPNMTDFWGINKNTKKKLNQKGIDSIYDRYVPKSKSIGNSQVLTKDYTNIIEIKIVLKEMAEQVAARLRNKNVKTGCIHIGVGYSRHARETGFSRQMKIPSTNLSKELVTYSFILFDKFYKGEVVRNLAVHCSKLTKDDALQLNLFDEPEELISTYSLDKTVDKIRRVYGFS
ncbi:type VI secretion protein ImpB, partial [Acinetobacter baumannii]|nr:type VI secretion protein ImpB [Acinetobacter baumannii]